MKKKLSLAFIIVAMLACIFAISVNAEEISTSDYDRTYTLDGVSYPLWEQDSEGGYHPLIWYLNSENTMCSAWADGQTNVSGAYVELGSYEGQLSKMKVYESDGTSYTSDSSFVIVNLNGVKLKDNWSLKYIHYKAFHTNTGSNLDIYASYYENNVLKAVYLPDTLSHIGWHDKSKIQADNTAFYSFDNCTALEYVEFHNDTVLDDNIINRGSFSLCSSLKAISLPDSVTTIGGSAFKNCKSMQAVYLPSSLKTVNINTGSHTFEGCDNMYFVNEPFVMSSAAQMPQKPNVYYFPSNLTIIPKLSLNCNKMVIIGTGVTSHSTGTYAGSGVETAVYLGNMTSFSLIAEQATRLNILFPNTTAVPTVSATGKNFNGSAVYLCKLNKSYNFDDKAWTENTAHFEDISKTIITESTSCTEPDKKTTKCYCGEQIGTFGIEGTSGENHDLEISNGAEIISITYSDVTKNGTSVIKCAKCKTEQEATAEAILTGYLGYSTPTDEARKGITLGYDINTKALDEYRAYNTTFEFGFIVAIDAYLDGNAPLNENGKANSNVIKAPILGTYNRVDFVLNGDIWDQEVQLKDGEEKVLVSQIAFLMCAYSYSESTGVQYIQDSCISLESIKTISYEEACKQVEE